MKHDRAKDLCRRLKPFLGMKVDALWATFVAEDSEGKADIEQTLELLAAKHLGLDYQPDRWPFPPPDRRFAAAGDVPVGTIAFGPKKLYPFRLKSPRLTEHLLIAGRSGSGKTNLTFVAMQGLMERGIKVLAIDWKRGYRDLMPLRDDLRVYTVGRDVSPFRFNPLIPPPGCEPNVWIKLIVDVIASAYLGGEGVISLLVAGLDHLYQQRTQAIDTCVKWPTVSDLLVWLRTVKLKGRAAMWQASAERILLAMTYGDFGAVVDAQDNACVLDLLDHNVVLEMDGLSSQSDRRLFSEALTLYLYRYRLARGPRRALTNLIVLEEAHNLLLRKAAEARESVLETSIRMIRQYGMGYVFVDQSASLLSKVAFANSYATIALNQKLRSDVQTIAGAMNLSDEQKEVLSKLAIGTAVVRLADEYPEPFMVNVPRSLVREGSVSDEAVRARMGGCSGKSSSARAGQHEPPAIPALPSQDKKDKKPEPATERRSHPPNPEGTTEPGSPSSVVVSHLPPSPPHQAPDMSREDIRFLADVAAHPLSTTVPRYQRLNLSRRRGNAIRQHLEVAGIIEPVRLATRAGQVVLYELTDLGRAVCRRQHIAPGPAPPESLEHRYWTRRVRQHFEAEGWEVEQEHVVQGNGVVDLVAKRPGRRAAIEIETGKSNVLGNLSKLRHAEFDSIVLVATSPEAVTVCQKAIEKTASQVGKRGRSDDGAAVTLTTWLDVS